MYPNKIDQVKIFLDQVKQLKAKHATMEEVIAFVQQIRQNNIITFPLDPLVANHLYDMIMPYNNDWQYQHEFLIRRFIHSHLQNFYTERVIAALQCEDEKNIHSSLSYPLSAETIMLIYGDQNFIKLLGDFEKCLEKNCLPIWLTIMLNHLPYGIELLLNPLDETLTQRIDVIRKKISERQVNKFKTLHDSKQNPAEFMKISIIFKSDSQYTFILEDNTQFTGYIWRDGKSI